MQIFGNVKIRRRQSDEKERGRETTFAMRQRYPHVMLAMRSHTIITLQHAQFSTNRSKMRFSATSGWGVCGCACMFSNRISDVTSFAFTVDEYIKWENKKSFSDTRTRFMLYGPWEPSDWLALANNQWINCMHFRTNGCFDTAQWTGTYTITFTTSSGRPRMFAKNVTHRMRVADTTIQTQKFD